MNTHEYILRNMHIYTPVFRMMYDRMIGGKSLPPQNIAEAVRR